MKSPWSGRTYCQPPLRRGPSTDTSDSNECSRFKRWWHLWWRYDYLKVKSRREWPHPPRRSLRLPSSCGRVLKKIATLSSGETVARPALLDSQSVRRRSRGNQPRVRSMHGQRDGHESVRRSQQRPLFRAAERQRRFSPAKVGIDRISGFDTDRWSA